MTIARVLLPLAAVLMLGAALPAFAEDGETPFPKELEGMLDEWSLQQGDGADFECSITLTSEWGIGGYQVYVPEYCADLAPASDIAAWYIGEDGSLIFINALRETVLTLQEMGDGGMFGTDADDPAPQFYLMRSEDPECG